MPPVALLLNLIIATNCFLAYTAFVDNYVPPSDPEGEPVVLFHFSPSPFLTFSILVYSGGETAEAAAPAETAGYEALPPESTSEGTAHSAARRFTFLNSVQFNLFE